MTFQVRTIQTLSKIFKWPQLKKSYIFEKKAYVGLTNTHKNFFVFDKKIIKKVFRNYLKILYSKTYVCITSENI